MHINDTHTKRESEAQYQVEQLRGCVDHGAADLVQLVALVRDLLRKAEVRDLDRPVPWFLVLVLVLVCWHLAFDTSNPE